MPWQGTENEACGESNFFDRLVLKLCTRVKMVMQRTRSMILDDLERLELMIVTTGRLSHQKQIRLPDQWGPHRKQAI